MAFVECSKSQKYDYIVAGTTLIINKLCHVGHFLGVQNIVLLKALTNGQFVMHACDLICIH
jgi:hypothetical protein